jgi:hypothetical protein
MMEGPGADSEEKHEPVSGIDIAVVDSLKCLTPNGRLEKQTLPSFPGRICASFAHWAAEPDQNVNVLTSLGRRITSWTN